MRYFALKFQKLSSLLPRQHPYPSASYSKVVDPPLAVNAVR